MTRLLLPLIGLLLFASGVVTGLALSLGAPCEKCREFAYEIQLREMQEK